ncbi:hypothetical protein [Actinoplanes sp. NPDC049118]|uniref:hypothetical protein n=1 Tax=Actinoplanes sp. NPDC049118 TaxID=3155769 RepID=UPI0033F0D14D
MKLPELPVEEVVPLLLDQVEALADAVPARYRGLIATDVGSGLRQGQAFGLEVPHVDFLRRTIKVEQQIQPAAGGGVVICPPKNRYSYRMVPVGQVAVDELAAHLAEFPAQDVEVLDITGRRPVTRTARLIFTDDGGRPLHRGSFNRGGMTDVYTAQRGLSGSTAYLALK